MKKIIGKKKCIELITNALNEVYGNTLWEDNTDLRMAKAVLKKLSPYLLIDNKIDMTEEEFKKWKKSRTPDCAEYNGIFEE